MLEIKQVSIEEIFEQIKLLLEKNAEEMSRGDLFVYKPRYEVFEQLEKLGKLLIVGAFIDAKLAGYTVSLVDNHIHYSDLLVCSNNICYVDIEHRCSKIGLSLMKETEKLAKNYGCQLVIWQAKPETSMHKILDKRYKLLEFNYYKEL